MKRILPFFSLLILGFSSIQAQGVPSSCTVPPILWQEYERDFVNLSMTAMYTLSSPDTQYVRVPATWMNEVSSGIAAIFNATSIPERDSVFDLYCVHDNTSAIQTYSGYLINVDTNYAWTSAWRNMQTLTGNPAVDSLLTKYDLTLTQYFAWSFGHYALLNTDSLWNQRALIDSLEQVPGIIYGEPDAIVGSAGKIDYYNGATGQFYDFYFQFNDCFDGCDNYRVWHFKVWQNCNVEYLGFDDWGFFGIEPLPAPLNCNITTGGIGLPKEVEFAVFPNPVDGVLRVQVPGDGADAGYRVELWDMMGRKVMASAPFAGELEVDVRGLSAGVYSVVLMADDGIVGVRKIVKE
jgi:hypothetical protein